MLTVKIAYSRIKMVTVKYKLEHLLLEKSLTLTQKKLSTFLFAVQGVGIVFISIFLAAYLAGLPTTNVLHIEPAFRIPLAIIGSLFLVLVFVAIFLAAKQKKN
jgi:hypothetical protein